MWVGAWGGVEIWEWELDPIIHDSSHEKIKRRCLQEYLFFFCLFSPNNIKKQQNWGASELTHTLYYWLSALQTYINGPTTRIFTHWYVTKLNIIMYFYLISFWMPFTLMGRSGGTIRDFDLCSILGTCWESSPRLESSGGIDKEGECELDETKEKNR